MIGLRGAEPDNDDNDFDDLQGIYEADSLEDAEDQAERMMIAWRPPADPDVIMDYDIVLIPTSYDKHYQTLEFIDKEGYRDSVQLEAHAIGAIGNPVILYGKYDIEQIWLPFVQAVLASAPPTREQRVRKLIEERRAQEEFEWRSRREYGSYRDEIQRKLKAPFYVRDEEKRMYHFPTNRRGRSEFRQFLLPFSEFQEITNKQDLFASQDNFDHDSDGELLTLGIAGQVEAVRRWLVTNTVGRFYHEKGTWTFDRYEDWLHVKLKFQGAKPYNGDDD